MRTLTARLQKGVLIATACGAMCIFICGCQSGQSKSNFAKETVRDEVPVMLLRAESFRFLEQFTKKVESTADQIIRSTEDSRIKRAALEWKIYAIPECMTAQDNPSALAGLIDMWVLTMQMRDYFETGLGAGLFGDHHHLVSNITEDLLNDADDAARYILKPEGYERIVQRARKFSAENPLDGSNFDRPFSSQEMQSILSGVDAGVFAVAQNLEIEVIKMQVKLGYYAELMPRIARWQAELFALDLHEHTIEPMIEEAWTSISNERSAVLQDVNRQRLETLEFVDSQKADVLAHVTRERAALAGDMQQLADDAIRRFEDRIENEHIKLHEFLEVQTEAVLETIRIERKKTVDEIAQIADGTVDRAYNKLWLVLVVLWFGVAGLLLVARLLFRPTKHGSNPG